MTPQSVTYSADGNCAVFGFSFAAQEASDLEVLLNGSVQTGGYAILGGEGVSPGGAVQFASSPSVGTAVTLRRTGRVQVSGSDAPGFLESKVVAGPHITVTKTSDAAGEHLSIATDINPAAFATAAQGAKADSALQPAVIDTDDTLAANSDSLIPSQKAVKTYVDGKVGTAISDIANDEKNILRQALSSAVHGGIEAESLFGGVCDTFNADTIGGNSSGQTYDGSGKLYGNPGSITTTSTASAWSGATGAYTLGTGTIDLNLNSGNNFIKNNNTFSGDFSVTLTLYLGTYNQCSSDHVGFGFYPISADGSWTNSGTSGDAPAPTLVTGAFSVWANNIANGGILAAGVTQSSVTFGPGTTFVFARVGTTVSLKKNGVTVWTYSQSSSDSVRFWAGSVADNGTHFNNVAWTEAATSTDMTLVSNALSPAPASAPSKVKLLVAWKAIDAAALNTDFTAEATRDGAIWTAGTLSDTGLTIAGFKLLWAEVDVSGQPSGTSVKVRLKTFNTKAQQVKGVALLAK